MTHGLIRNVKPHCNLNVRGATPSPLCRPPAGADCVIIMRVIVVDCVASDRCPPGRLPSRCLFTGRFDTRLCVRMGQTKQNGACANNKASFFCLGEVEQVRRGWVVY